MTIPTTSPAAEGMPTPPRYHFVGIDPSLSATGVATIRPHDPIPIRVRLVESKPVPNAKYPHTLARIRRLAGDIVRTVRDGAEDGDIIIVVMEGPIFGQSTGQYHTRAGLWWILYHLLEKFSGFAVIEPTKLKRYVTGKGNAPKDLVFASVIRNFPSVGVVDNNEADALGLAAMAARQFGFPMEPSVQRVTPNALEGVDWPYFTTEEN